MNLKTASNKPVKATVILESSDDLQSWTLSSDPQTLFFLPGADGEINKNRLETSIHGDMKYIRLVILGNRENFAELIDDVEGHYNRKSSLTPKLQWLQATKIKALEDDALEGKQSWQYPIPDLVPVSQIRLSPGKGIVFYSGSIYLQPAIDLTSNKITNKQKEKLKTALKQALKSTGSAKKIFDPSWHYVRHFQQFHLHDSEAAASVAPLTFSVQQGKVWRFHFDQPTDILPSQLPELALGWEPSQIAFIAQGPGPFRLLVGCTEVVDSMSHNSYLTNADDENAQRVELMPEVDNNRTVAKRPVIDPHNESLDWVKILLWIVLLAGVALMVFMAVQLSKKMKADQGEAAP
ncbi:MAG: hypothetical protein ACI9KN_002051 [Gammaproteobacteria bacterium]